MSALDIALGFIGLRWSPVPVPYKAKKPIIKRWHKLRITETDAPQYFNGKAENVGVILGPASQGLTDVDLDCAEAVAVAPCLLPRTAAIFGRESRRSSHWLYRTDLGNTRDKATIEYLDPLRPKREKATVAELRVGGGGKGHRPSFPAARTRPAKRSNGRRLATLPRWTATTFIAVSDVSPPPRSWPAIGQTVRGTRRRSPSAGCWRTAAGNSPTLSCSSRLLQRRLVIRNGRIAFKP